jgi:hypothetical protein
MIHMSRQLCLSEIVADEGLSISDVAFFSGLSRNTISRHWYDANWLDHVSGKSLQALASSVPGVMAYLLALVPAGRHPDAL